MYTDRLTCRDKENQFRNNCHFQPINRKTSAMTNIYQIANNKFTNRNLTDGISVIRGARRRLNGCWIYVRLSKRIWSSVKHYVRDRGWNRTEMSRF